MRLDRRGFDWIKRFSDYQKWLSRRYAQPTQILAAFDALIPDEFVSGGSSELRLESLVGGGLETTVFSLTRVCFHKVGVHVVAAGQVASFPLFGVGWPCGLFLDLNI